MTERPRRWHRNRQKEKHMKVTQEQFDQKLVEILSGMTGAQLLSIPGIYEILAEEFNNDVFDALS